MTMKRRKTTQNSLIAELILRRGDRFQNVLFIYSGLYKILENSIMKQNM
jgi:hypothetical protein